MLLSDSSCVASFELSQFDFFNPFDLSLYKHFLVYMFTVEDGKYKKHKKERNSCYFAILSSFAFLLMHCFQVSCPPVPLFFFQFPKSNGNKSRRDYSTFLKDSWIE